MLFCTAKVLDSPVPGAHKRGRPSCVNSSGIGENQRTQVALVTLTENYDKQGGFQTLTVLTLSPSCKFPVKRAEKPLSDSPGPVPKVMGFKAARTDKQAQSIDRCGYPKPITACPLGTGTRLAGCRRGVQGRPEIESFVGGSPPTYTGEG